MGLMRHRDTARHFGSYKPGKLRGTLHKRRNSAVKSSLLSCTRQYKNVYSKISSLLPSTVTGLASKYETSTTTDYLLFYTLLQHDVQWNGSLGVYLYFINVYVTDYIHGIQIPH